MLRSVLLSITLSILFLLCPNHASASFEITYGVHYYIPEAPKAQFDNRIDQRLVRAAHLADQRASAHTKLRCWQYVKRALLDAGAVNSYPSTNYAKQAGTELKTRYGFVRLNIRDPYNAPVGSVIVYGGAGAGHVELRTPRGFASDYHSAWRCRYPVLGVYARLSA